MGNNQEGIDELSLVQIIDSIKQIIQKLRLAYKRIFLIGALAFLVGFFYSYYFKVVLYKSELTFAIEDNSGSGGNPLSGALGLASSFGVDIGGGNNSMFASSNLMELFKSKRVVIDALLNKYPPNANLSYADYFIQHSREGAIFKEAILKDNINYKNYKLGQNKIADSILMIIHKYITAKSLNVNQIDRKISIIKVSFTFSDENFSKMFCEALVNEISKFYIETRSKKAKQNVEILKWQVDSVRRELNNALAGVAQANDNSFNLNSALNINRVPSSRRQIDVQANTAILTELVKNLELGRLALRKETPLIQVIDSPNLPLERIGQSKIMNGIKLSFLSTLTYLIFFIVTFYYKQVKSNYFKNKK
jgi:uncharacterized protein involved in exopolysaccharide biosynthesis